MHPLRILRESGHETVEQNKALRAEHVVFHSPVLVKAVTGRDVVAAIFATSLLRERTVAYRPFPAVAIFRAAV